MNATCQLCETSGPMPVLYPQHQILKCPRCGLVFYAGRIDPAEVYTEEYFIGTDYPDYLSEEAALRRTFRGCVRFLRTVKGGGRLLEIGSAYGLFLDEARRYYDVRGVDIAAGPAAYARDRLGLDVVAGDFLALPEEPESYDLICMWNTIEHLDRPFCFVQKAARWLRPGGALVMTTGDVESFVARFRKDKWRLIHPPTHLFYFSPATLRRAVERAGLVAEPWKYVGYFRSYRSIVQTLFALGPRKRPWLCWWLTLGGRIDFDVPLKLYDVHLYGGRKPAQRPAAGRGPRSEEAR
jgi:SAM-dependent methyltransferase